MVHSATVQTPGISIPRFDRARALVLGDPMLDRYWYGDTARVSPEAPVPVVHVRDVEERPGGAGNVAVNIAALGAPVTLWGPVGRDEAAVRLAELLEARGVTLALRAREDRPTVTKLRVVSRHQQLIRLDFEDPPRGEDLPAGGDWLAPLTAGTRVAVLSDYGKGALSNVAELVRALRARGLPVLVDPKGEDYGGYRGATLITPNLAELERVVGECHDLDRLVAKGERLCRELDLEGLLVTRSEQGMSLLRPGSEAIHLPARAREVFDVTGAGDTVIGVMAAAIAAGQDLPDAMALANLAAGLVVAKLGTASVTADELRGALHEGPYVCPGVLDEEAVIAVTRLARERGETVVMTNGCFDILHAAHVRLLTHARALGDRLVVAVNDDASVQRLKGHGRPINTLSRRMAVLDALACVDWVVPFAEDDPERLICSVSPEVLVKGGDYRPEEVAGGDCVREHGGQVTILGYEEGYSTTAIVDALQRSVGDVEEGSEGA